MQQRSTDGFSIVGGNMLKMLNATSMHRVDGLATRRYAIPSVILMENAGRSVVDVAASKLDGLEGKRILIVAGKGNNGGDGFVAARHAAHRGAMVDVLLTAGADSLRDDALQAYEMIATAGHPALRLIPISKFASVRKRSYDSIIDAIFGTSFHGEIRGTLQSIVRWMNTSPALVIAVDIPSGLDATTGKSAPCTVKADVTVTMAALKPGLLLGSGREYCGEVLVADIHVPEELILSVGDDIFAAERQDIIEHLPVRPATAHKYSVGKIFALAGSRRFTGAALLTSRAAMKAGAGAVVLGIPATEFSTVARRTLEVMPLSLDATVDGTVAASAGKMIFEKLRWADALVIGPGLGRNKETASLIRRVVSETNLPILLDADGLNAFAGLTALLRKTKSRNIVLTPHAGEFARLLNLPVKDVEEDGLSLAQKFSKHHGVVLVLKGASTIIASPDGRVAVNTTGNPGMATAGAGDVLSGIIGALLSQRVDAFWAAIVGTYIHGRAGDFATEALGERSTMASDIVKQLPSAILSL
jgi:NAD(P)H-hydrate epimerase